MQNTKNGMTLFQIFLLFCVKSGVCGLHGLVAVSHVAMESNPGTGHVKKGIVRGKNKKLNLVLKGNVHVSL